MKKTKFWIDRYSFFAGASITCMIFAVIYRLLGSIPNYADRNFIVFELAVPVACALLYIICIVFFGKKGFWLSFIPILIGCVYLIFKSFSLENNILIIACVFATLAVAVLYTSTVFGAINTKWIIVFVIIVPLIVNIVLRDWPVIYGIRTAGFHSVMLEMSILFIGFGFLFGALGLRKIVSAEKEKSRDIVPPVPGQKIGGIFSKRPSEQKTASDETAAPESNISSENLTVDESTSDSIDSPVVSSENINVETEAVKEAAAAEKAEEETKEKTE